MSDRMVVMKDGRVQEMGDADEVYRNPEKDYTRKLIDAIPKGEIEDIEASLAKKEELRRGRVSSSA